MFRRLFPTATLQSVSRTLRVVLFLSALLVAALSSGRLQLAQESVRSPRGPALALPNLPLPSPRVLHTATLLPTGKVLVVGGSSDGTPGGAQQSALIYDPFKGDWADVPAPATARYGHVATLLQNGKVLIAGGRNASGILQSAELFDPVTNQWAATGALVGKRFRATVTLLAYASNAGGTGTSNPRNGSVLVIGGQNDAGALDTAEIYNPATGVWKATATPMSAKRSGHTATQLTSGDILVAGGFSIAQQPVNTVDLYDPLNDKWKSVGKLNAARYGHTATLLTTGQVMVVGGLNANGAALDSAELYDPINRTFSTVASKLAQARAFHSASLLPSGALFVMGGFASSSGTGIQTAESYDPTSTNLQQWVPAGTFLDARGAHTATLMANARVLLVGGSANADGSGTLASVELHDPASGKWSLEKLLNRARIEHTATLLASGKVLVAGGRDATGSLKAAELFNYDYSTNAGTWIPTSDMNVARQAHTATLLPNGKVLVAGGISSGSVLSSAELYDPATGSWTFTGNSMPTPRREHTATLLPNGTVLVTGGRSTTNAALKVCDLYNPATNMWTSVAQMNDARVGHTATLLYDGRVLAVGGAPLPGQTTSLKTSELYDYNANRWTAVVSQLSVGYQEHTATLLPNGRVLIVSGLRGAGGLPTDYSGSAHLFNPSNSTWASVTAPTGRVGHTATLLQNGKVLIVGGYTIISSLGTNATLFADTVQIYDPARGTSVLGTAVPFTTIASLNGHRDSHTATLLPNGKVLVAGGLRQSNVGGTTITEYLRTTETFDVGLGVDELAETVSPFITSASWNGPGNALCAAGIRFQGVSEAGSGGAAGSYSNYPVVQLMRLDNEQQYYLSPDANTTACATKGWSNNGYGSLPVPATTTLGTNNNMQPGPVMMTVFVNGMPNRRSVVLTTGGAGGSTDSDTVNLTGRVYTVADAGLQVNVELRGSDGSVRTVRSGPNGEYVFPDVPTRTPGASLNNVTPGQILIGTTNAQITVTGTGFRPNTTPGAPANEILFNGQALTTTYDSPTQLHATIPSQFLQSPGFASVSVRINTNGVITVTPPVTIEITTSSPTATPEITRLSPATARAGTTNLEVTINGFNLLNGTTQIQWNGQARSPLPGRGSNTQLVFVPLASDLAQAGAAAVRVVNAGGTSNTVTFTVTDAGPSISGVSPSSYTLPTASAVAQTAVTLTINGSGFQSSSVVRASGLNLSTTFVSATQLRATLPPGLIYANTNLLLSVFNSAAGTSSNIVSFPINLTATPATGSVLVYPFFATGGGDSTTLTLTNANPSQGVGVYLFMVNGATGTSGLNYFPMSPNQTRSLVVSQLSVPVTPGVAVTTGYAVAVAYNSGGCPTSFNFLRGTANIVRSTGHTASLNAVPLRALSGASCSSEAFATTLNFNGSSYDRVPNQLVADNIPSLADDNNTQLIVSAFGGSLFSSGPGTVATASPVATLLGLLYDNNQNVVSFSFGSNTAQSISTFSSVFPRSSPNFGSFITKGETGLLTFYRNSTDGPGYFGAVLNRGPAFNGGYLLRPATLKSTSLTVPVFSSISFFTARQGERTTGDLPRSAAATPPPVRDQAQTVPAAQAAEPAVAQQQQPGSPITYNITPSGTIPTGEDIEFEPPVRTVTPAGGDIVVRFNDRGERVTTAPEGNDDNSFCGYTSAGLQIAGTLSGLNGATADVVMQLTNKKAPGCPLPDQFMVTSSGAGTYAAKNIGATKPMGLDGSYQLMPTKTNYDFKYAPIDPNNPDKDKSNVTLPPLWGASLGWNFNAIPQVVCPTVTANAGPDQMMCQPQGGVTVFTLNGTVANGTPAWTGANLSGTANVQAISSPGSASTMVSVTGVGSVRLRLLVTPIAGCNAVDDFVDLVVNPAPAATITPVQSSLCAGAAGSASVPDAGAGATYTWSVTGGSLTSGQGTRTVSYTAGASGTVTLNVTVSNNLACSASSSAQITINTAPSAAITTPAAVCASSTGNAASVPDAGGGATYNWSITGGTITSAANIRNITYTAGASGNVMLNATVTSGAGCGTSSSVNVPINAAPSVTTQPANQTACENAPVSFTASATGSSGVQWQVSTDGGNQFNNLAGQTNSTLNLTAALAQNGYRYRAVFSGSCGTANTNPATLTVTPATAITTQPTVQSVCLGTAANFSVAATGQNLTYQWRKGGQNIGGATNSSYSIPAVSLTDAGSYDVVVTGACGTATSSAVALTVNSYEADLAPRSNGNCQVTMSDWALVGNLVAGLTDAPNAAEFQRADCAPRATLGNGILTVSDWVQAGRYAAGLDPLVQVGGPTASLRDASPFSFADVDVAAQLLKWVNWPEARALRLRTEGGKPGKNLSMAVELDAFGQENAVSFSLNFDPARWRWQSSTLAPGVESARLLLNRTQLKEGRLGIVLALPPGETLSAGRRQLALLQFAPLGGETDPPTLSFGDAPVGRELIDVNAESLPVNFAQESERPLAVVSAADVTQQKLARESIALAIGGNLASDATKASGQPLPVQLSGTQVILTDSQGVEHLAPLFSISPEQVTFQVPAAAALGAATLAVRNAENQVSQARVEIVATAPAIFADESGGQGWPAATLLRIHADGRVNYEPVLRVDPTQKRLTASPIEFGEEPAQLVLVLFGTGLRNHTGTLTAKVGSYELPVLFAGAQGELAGLDQVNLALPRALAGSGEVVLRLLVDGQQTNPIRVVIR